MKELRDSETHVNSFHRGLRSLSHMLTEAKALLEEAPAVMDVEEYLKKTNVRNVYNSTPIAADMSRVELIVHL